MATEILCPYCFERWSRSVAAFRCMSEDAQRCPRVPDEDLGRLQGTEAPNLPRVEVHQGRFGREWKQKRGKRIKCKCGAPMKRICPECHSDLPLRFADAPSRTMALIGTKASGKTHYIAVTLQELEHRVGHRFNGSFLLLDDHTQRRVDTEFRPRLYGSGTVLDATSSARGSTATALPLVSRLTLGKEKPVSSTLVFFDSAGEDLVSRNIVERDARYVTHSDGLVLLVDPLQIPAIRDELEGDVELPDEVTDPYQMLGIVGNLLRDTRGIPSDQQIDVPLAIAISKIDTMRVLLGDEHPVFSSPIHSGQYDATTAENISQALRADLARLMGQRFDSLANQDFARVAYFGLSSLGASPVEGTIPNGVAPHRVEDPILWMLNEWGGIPA